MSIVLALVLNLVISAAALAQSDTATLTVSVIDSSAAAVPGATVVVANLATGLARELISDSNGRASFPVLQPGEYAVTVSLDGFKQYRDSGVRLQVAQSATVDALLAPGDISEAIEVTAGARLLDLDTVSQGTVITEDKVQALPLNGRQFIQLALLVPGANPGGRAVQQNVVRQNQVGGFSVSGGRTNNTAFLLDGAVNTDPDYNSLNYSPSIDAIAEFQVQTAQFSAEYGRAGGQVNVVTKSGGAQLRGSLFEYLRGRHRRNDTPPEVFLLRRAAAYQAYFEHMPLRAAALPVGPRLQLYRRLVFGNLIDLSVLDTRQYRSDQACGHGAATNCAAAADPARSILGASQEKWLFDQLALARARWTVLGQQVPTFARDNGADSNPMTRFSMDKWDGYTASRQRLFDRLRDTRAANPIVLSGDVHVHFAADLTHDFADPRSATVGVEFTNSSITSGGDGSDTAGHWDRLRALNPHIRFHSNRRGYVACTATAATMRAEFKVVTRVTVPHEPIRTAQAIVVEAGRPGGTPD